MNVCNLSDGHFEFMLVEAVAGFKSGASPSKIVIDVKREPDANIGTLCTSGKGNSAKPPD